MEELFQPLHSYQATSLKLKDIKIKFNSKVVDWLAYPEYTLGDDLNSFVLTPGLYYTSRLAILELLRENVHYNQ